MWFLWSSYSLSSKLKPLEKCGTAWRFNPMSLFSGFYFSTSIVITLPCSQQVQYETFLFLCQWECFCRMHFVICQKKLVSFNFLNNQFYVYTIAQWKGAFAWLSFPKGFACRLHLERSCIRIANEHSEMLFCHSLFWLSWKCHCQVLWQNEKR